jgi:hypothetical protein
MTMVIVAFRNFAKAPKNTSPFRTVLMVRWKQSWIVAERADYMTQGRVIYKWLSCVRRGVSLLSVYMSIMSYLS